jgi:hypothetical protein
MTRMLSLAAVLLGMAGPGPTRAADPAADAAQAYTLEASAAPAAVKVGEAGKVAVVIRPKPTWHVHPQAPLKVRFTAPPGLKVERPELGRKDVSDPKAEAPRYETGFVATTAGAQRVDASVDFFICSDTACVKQARTLPIAVTVK